MKCIAAAADSVPKPVDAPKLVEKIGTWLQ
jgi:hypothetical protein